MRGCCWDFRSHCRSSSRASSSCLPQHCTRGDARLHCVGLNSIRRPAFKTCSIEGSPSLAGRPPSFDHVLGDARLRDLKPELEQFAVDAWRSPKRVLDIHPPDQHTQIGLDLWPPSPSARLPTPVAAKARPVPTHKGLGPDNCENLQNCRKPAIELDKEPAIMVHEPDATMQSAPQDNQLMSKHRVLSLEPHLRLERRGHGGQDETEKSDHSASLGNFITSSTRTGFSVHTGAVCGRWPRELVVNVAARGWSLRRCVVLTQKWAKRAAALQHARPIMRLRLICRVWATCAACGAEYDYDARAHTFLRVVRSGVPDDEGEANAS